MKTILFVDDDPGILDMYGLFFSLPPRKDQYRFLTASTIEKGKEVIMQEHPDLILLDLILQKIFVPQSYAEIEQEERSKEYGFNLLKEIKESPATKSIPVIILSNLSSVQDKDRATSLGADGYLVKSDVVPAQVLEVIQKHLPQ